MAANSSANIKKAIPLCLPNNLRWNPKTGEIRKTQEQRHTLCVVDAAMAELRKIKEPVCVVAIAGPCRDGKSYILTETFGQSEVFPVGYKMDPKTMGIWMWTLPFKMQDRGGREFAVVLLDTEGTDAPMAQGREDKKIFILTVLLASVLIYNSKGVAKRNDLNELDFVTRLSKQIRAISNSSKTVVENEDAFHKTFPFFIWLLRDAMTDLPEDCSDIKDYFLKRVFKDPGSDPSRVDSTQRIANSILRYFSGFDAFCLPPPTFNKELMKDVKRNRDAMNPEFFSGVNQFEKLLKSHMEPKKSANEGEYVTGEALATMTELYLQAINDPRSIPNVQSTWETHVQTKCQEAKKKALEAYDKKMSSDLSRLPCDGEKVQGVHKTAVIQAMALFRQDTIWIVFEHTKKDEESIMSQTNQKLNEWKSKNDQLTKDSCEKYLKELKQKRFDPVMARIRGKADPSVSYKDIEAACTKIEIDYKANAVGAKDIRAQVFREFHEHLKVESEHYKDLLKQLQDYDETLMQIRRDHAVKDEEVEKLKATNEYLLNQQKFQEQQLREIERKKTKELEDKLKEFQMKEAILQQKINDMEKAGMNEQIRSLKSELENIKEETVRGETQMQDLRDMFKALTLELKRANRPWWKKLFGRE